MKWTFQYGWPGRSGTGWSWLVLGGLGLASAGWLVAHARAQTPAVMVTESIPTAGVAMVSREDLAREVAIAAEFRPYAEVALHAKVSGYVRQMAVDFGDTVKAGQLLATLEVPELQAELQRAEAAEKKAEADHDNAQLIYSRLLSVNQSHPNLVAQQELDTAKANELATVASIAAAQAEVAKYRTMADYTRITAPFDGVVTHRYAEPGTLIQAGTASDTQSLPLVRVADNYRLRLDFPVTVDYVKDIHVGDPVAIEVDSLKGRTITGTISRFTHEVDGNTRTMLTEVEVANEQLELVPGMYARVRLNVAQRTNALTVPTQAVINGPSPAVFLVNQNHQLERQPVTLGLETPDKVEILSGLQAGDLVVVGNLGNCQAGQRVEPKVVELSLGGSH
ncbi:MAG TPA: efflux RND transporter periplasmic adaptor subunit [Verrucomicrobiae bacterium]